MKIYIVLLLLVSISSQSSGKEKIEGFYNPETNLFETEDENYWIDYFEGTVCKISQNGLFGLMDTSGTIICPAKYERIHPFQQECAVVYFNREWGLIDIEGNLICPLKFDYIVPFKYKHSLVKLNNKWGIINNKGCVILWPEYNSIRPFTNKLTTSFYKKDEETGESIKGLINHKGEIVMETAKDASIFDFHEGLARYYDSKAQEICFIDSLGDFISIDLPYKDLLASLHFNQNGDASKMLIYSNGLAPFAIKQAPYVYTYGFLNKKGKVVIPPVFDSMLPFKGAYTSLKLHDEWCTLHKSGKIILKDTCDKMTVIQDKWILIQKKDASGVLNLKGDTIIPFEYEYINYLFGDLFFAQTVMSNSHKVSSLEDFARQDFINSLPAFTVELSEGLTSLDPFLKFVLNLSEEETGGVLNTSLDTIVPFLYSNVDYVTNQKDTLLIAQKDTCLIRLTDLVIRSLHVPDRISFAGYYIPYYTDGRKKKAPKYTYEGFAIGLSNTFLNPFGFSYNSLHFPYNRKHYLIDQKFPSTEYHIESERLGTILIKKKQRYALVDLRGKILKPFSKKRHKHYLIKE